MPRSSSTFGIRKGRIVQLFSALASLIALITICRKRHSVTTCQEAEPNLRRNGSTAIFNRPSRQGVMNGPGVRSLIPSSSGSKEAHRSEKVGPGRAIRQPFESLVQSSRPSLQGLPPLREFSFPSCVRGRYVRVCSMLRVILHLPKVLPSRVFSPERKRPSGRWCPQRAAFSVAKLELASLPPGPPAGKSRSTQSHAVNGRPFRATQGHP